MSEPTYSSDYAKSLQAQTKNSSGATAWGSLGSIVAAVVAELKAARSEEDRFAAEHLSAFKAGRSTAATYLDGAYQNEGDRVDILCDLLSVFPAMTLIDAAVQQAQLVAAVDRFIDKYAEHAVGMERDKRQIFRLIYSVMMVVETASGQKIDDVAWRGFGSPNCNPWLPVEERCPDFTDKAEGK